jgi:hypothetical protein
MKKLINQESSLYSLVGDIQQEVFENICLKPLNDKLIKLFGEYASANLDVIKTDDGGYIQVSFEMENISSELVNFSDEVLSKTLNLIQEVCSENITNFIDAYELTADVAWGENLGIKVDLFLRGKEFTEYIKESDLEYLKEVEIFLNALKVSIEEKVDAIMQDAVNEFNDFWYYNSSSFLGESILES